MSLADKQKVMFGLTIVFVALLLIGAFSVDQLDKQTRSRLSVLHTLAVMQQIQFIADAIKDSETGQRGFVLTGNEEYLKPFNDAAPRVDELISDLRDLTKGDAGQQAKLGVLQLRADEKIAELRETIGLVRANRAPEALAIVRSNRGKDSMDEIRRIVVDMVAKENRSLSERTAALNQQAVRTSAAISILIILTAIVLFLMSILLWRFLEAKELSTCKIEKNQKELEDFFENSIVPMHWLDGKGTILKVNQAECDLLGYKRSELFGRNIAEFHIDSDALEAIFYTLRANEALQNFEARLRCSDGSIKTVLIDSNVQFEDGKFIHSRCFTRDITSLKKAESELKENETRNRTLVQTAPDAIITFDLDGLIESSNEASGAIFNCRPEDIVGRNLSQFLPGFFSDKEHMSEIDAISTGQSQIFGIGREITGVTMDGAQMPVELAWSVLNLGKRSVFTAIIRNISQRKELEQRLSLQYEIARILSEAQSVEQVASQVLATVGQLMDWATGAMWLVDRKEEIMQCADVWCVDELIGSKFLQVCKDINFSIGVGLPGRVWQTAIPHSIEDLSTDNNFPRLPVATESGLKSAFAFPLVSGSRVLGVFEFFSDTFVIIDEQMQQTMSAIGSQIGQFIVQKETEEAQRLLDTRFRAVFEQSFQLMGLLSPEGKVLLANQTALEFAGVTEQDVVGVPFWLTPWWAHSRNAQKQLKEAIETVNKEDRLVRFETEYIGVNGDKMIVDFSLKPLFAADNSIYMLIAEGRDVTERKLAEEELKLSEGRFRQMAENISEIFWITDKLGRVPVYVSPAYGQIFGYSLESLRENPRQFFEVIYPEDREKVANVIRHQRKISSPCEVEYRIIRGDGSLRWLWTKVCSIYDSEGNVSGLCGVVHDITERKDAELRVSEFYSTVSHELRTPLTSIRGSLGLIEGGKTGQIPPLAMQMIKIGRVESERLIRLINDILDIKKLEAGHLEFNAEPVEPHILVEKTLAAIAGMASEFNVNLKSSVITSHQIFADYERLTQVVTNLVSNAIKFSPKEGTVTVSVRTRANDFLRFSVRDEGQGIPPEQMHKLFGMFQQLDSSDTRKVGGTGLGLAISKSIVEQHGGKIGVDSVKGQGATFWFDIPIGRKAGVPDASKVLVVGADETCAKGLEDVCGSDNFELIYSDNLLQARDELDHFRPALIFIDVELFDDRASQFIEDCQKQPDTTNIPIVLTGSPKNKVQWSQESNLLWVDQPFHCDQVDTIFLKALQNHHGDPSKVLIVEDDAATSEILLQQISAFDVVCSVATTGVDAVELAKDGKFDLIILDLALPLLDGYGVVKSLRDSNARNTPLIIYTNRDLKREDRVGLSLGLTTYFIKSRASEKDLLECVRKLLNKSVI
jgi:PAS domain S-box-containing protein